MGLTFALISKTITLGVRLTLRAYSISLTRGRAKAYQNHYSESKWIVLSRLGHIDLEEINMATCTGRNGDNWELYRTASGWRWRRTASNGRIVGASTEAYVNRSDCEANAKRNGMDCNPK